MAGNNEGEPKRTRHREKHSSDDLLQLTDEEARELGLTEDEAAEYRASMQGHISGSGRATDGKGVNPWGNGERYEATDHSTRKSRKTKDS